MLFLILSALAVAVPLVNAAGAMIVVNNCPTSFELHSVGSSISPGFTIGSHNSWAEDYHYDSKTGGINIAITSDTAGIFHGSPELDVQYTADFPAGKIWYTLSTTRGSPFAGRRIALTGNGCRSIVWENGVNPGTGTQACDINQPLTLTICA